MSEPGVLPNHAQGVQIVVESPADLAEYARVPIAFEVRSRLRVEPVDAGLGGLRLAEDPVEPPWVKDYDAVPVERPTGWPERFDVRNWGVLAAFCGERRVGGAAVAWNTRSLDILEGRRDLAVLWDLRVHPDWRRQGVGRVLFEGAARWARERGCRQLKVETQDINVPACRFYAAQGCTLGGIRRFAYREFPDEVELMWYREL